jgi:hypothetical protein
MLTALVFFRASVFKVRTCSVVQARRVETFLGIKQLPVLRNGRVVSGSSHKEKPKIPPAYSLLIKDLVSTRGRIR